MSFEFYFRQRPTFPDRHILFQPVHELAEQSERLGAMPRGNADVNRRLAHRHNADAMNDAREQARMIAGQCPR